MSTAYPSVRAALARLRARMGHTSAAREGYDALVASWPRADADLPLLITVKRERAALAK
jgi:hypothetical protein